MEAIHFCHYCKQNPGTTNGVVWKGFYDGDTKQKVCWGCRDKHYQEKAATEYKGLFSELPVTLIENIR